MKGTDFKCEIWGFHGGEDSSRVLLGCDTTTLNGVTTQKNSTLIFTAVKISNLAPECQVSTRCGERWCQIAVISGKIHRCECQL